MWDPNQDMNDTGQLKERLTRFSSWPSYLVSLEDLKDKEQFLEFFIPKRLLNDYLIFYHCLTNMKRTRDL